MTNPVQQADGRRCPRRWLGVVLF